MFNRMMNYGELELRPSTVITLDSIKKLLPKYRRHEDLIIIQEQAWNEFKSAMPFSVADNHENSPFSIDEDELASLVCQTIQKPICSRLAIEKSVKTDGHRTPNVQIILGKDGVVNHKDNHIIYRFDVTKCMFSFGNINEKMRMAELDCSNEIVVDLFAGIGYFTLPLLVHAKAKHLYACDWNPNAIEALRTNLTLNGISPNRYTVIEGDNRTSRPRDVAQRVVLGILPSCLNWMKTALECIDKRTGAILHCHDLVDSKASNSSTSPSSNCKQILNYSDAQPSTDSSRQHYQNNNHNQQQQPILDSNTLLSQSISSSSTSSHSTIEKLSVPSDDAARLLLSSESDKDTNSPVLLEKPANLSNMSLSEMTISTNSNSVNEYTSLESFNHEESLNCYEARGLVLIERIKEALDAYGLAARLMHIQPIKSYAPHVSHVVFDIQLEPMR